MLTAETDGTPEELRGVVGSVLCAVEPTLSSLEAARQAAVLARGGRLELVPVAPRRAGVSSAYLAAARYVAARLGTVAVAANAERGAGSGALVRGAGRDDLVVVGAGDGARLGAVARAAVTEAAAPVLVARRVAGGADLADRPLVVGAAGRHSAGQIIRAARAAAATLVVLECAGVLALLVAERAPCSVLVLRPSADGAP
jgi:hypothetical protein